MKRRKYRRTKPVGLAATNRKLTIPEVRYIKRLLLAEKKMRERTGRKIAPRGFRKRIADKFGVSVSCIKKIADKDRHQYIKVKLPASWGASL